MLKKCILLFALVTLASLVGCSRKEQLPQNSSGSSPQAADSAKPDAKTQEKTPSQQETIPDGKWVTIGIETGVFGPDGTQRRWVKLEAGRPIRLGKGEYVTLQGKKYTGRAGGRSVIRMESGQIKAYNVDAADS